MLSYEMVIAIGIAVMLVLAAIGGLAAWVMTVPEAIALSRAARVAEAQGHLMASPAQQARDARAAAAASIRRCIKLLYEDVLAAPLPPRLAALITQLETQEVSA
jgi:hypothetical protein